MALSMQRCWFRLRPLTLPWPAAGYHAKPLLLNLTGVYIPDPDDPKTKTWHKGPAFEAKLYGKYGSRSGVKPDQLWPSPQELQKIEEEEKEWCPSLKEMMSNVKAKEKALLQQQKERQRRIAANMAKMPKMVEEWRKAKRVAQLKERAEKDRKQRLLVMAREKLGINVDSRSTKFQEMVAEMDKEEKKKLKAVKRIQREEEKAAHEATITAAIAAKASTKATNPE